MSKNIHRGFVATLAAGALTLSLAPIASANLDDTDGPGIDVDVPEETAQAAEVFRIADSTRILTAIEASQSRTDWGEGVFFDSNVRWECEAPTSLSGTVVESPYSVGNKIMILGGFIAGVVVGEIDGEIDGDFNGDFNGDFDGEFDGDVSLGLDFGNLRLPRLVINTEGEIVGEVDGEFDGEFDGDFEGFFNGGFVGGFLGTGVTCEAVEKGDISSNERNMEIIVARADDYPDALAAGPLADVLNAPILLNPSGALDPNVAAEISRLASLGGPRFTTVHLLGGTDALSNGVKDSILGLVDNVIRYQGIDRYETAVGIATATVNQYGLESGALLPEVNAYLTTGINFPDALAAGAAAANNDGVVVLTDGTGLDRRGFTEQFLIDLDNLVDEGIVANTSEIFAVGGPSAAAATTFDIRLAPNGAYVGSDRYETATLTAVATFGQALSGDFAVVSGEGFADALVAGGFIANLDGPLLLTRADSLTAVTATYLNTYVMNGDRIFTFGGPDSLKVAVTQEIKDLLEKKFAIDPEIR